MHSSEITQSQSHLPYKISLNKIIALPVWRFQPSKSTWFHLVYSVCYQAPLKSGTCRSGKIAEESVAGCQAEYWSCGRTNAASFLLEMGVSAQDAPFGNARVRLPDLTIAAFLAALVRRLDGRHCKSEYSGESCRSSSRRGSLRAPFQVMQVHTYTIRGSCART